MLVFPTLKHSAEAQVKAKDWSDWSAFSVFGEDEVSADWWAKALKCKIYYALPNETFMILSTKYIGDALFANILLEESRGWIVIKDLLHLDLIQIKASTQP